MSPAVIHDGSQYLMWYLTSPTGCTSSYQDIHLCTSPDGIVWSAPQAVTLEQPGRVPWHFDVQLADGLYTMLFISYPDGSSCGSAILYHAESADGLVWNVFEGSVLGPSPGGWDNKNIYRASFTVDADWLRIWYSAQSTGGAWRVGYTEGDLEDFLAPPIGTWSEIYGDVQLSNEQPRQGAQCLREAGGAAYPQVFAALDGSDVCVNVWYREEMNTVKDFMALIRLWDSDTSVFTHHCIGAGVWTGTSTVDYSWHDEGFRYTASVLPRSAGWRHLSIAAVGDTYRMRIDDEQVAALDVLDPALINRFSIEARGGVGYFDDAYVRAYAEPEPTAVVGAEVATAVGGVPGPVAGLEQNVPNPLNPKTPMIAFRLAREGSFTLQIVDLKGRLAFSPCWPNHGLPAATRRIGTVVTRRAMRWPAAPTSTG